MARIDDVRTQLAEQQEILNAYRDAGMDDNDIESISAGLIQTVTDLEAELQQLETAASSAPAAPAVPPSASLNAQATLASIWTMMNSNQGTGFDDESLRKAIEAYFLANKIDLEKLGADVLEEIKKHQRVILELPNFSGFKLEIDSKDKDTPFFFEILDDVLAGNNVYLFGAAGAGKTVTAKAIAKTLKRPMVTINCSQYTSPTEVLGGQTIDGYKEGKLVNAWREGKILILDEMPRLDPNTAGLFNDALAQSSKTTKKQDARINSTNPEQAPFERNDNFALIATGNVYPNTNPPPEYKANFQQDLSLLDRFSGSVYKVDYSRVLDAKLCRFKFLHDMLIGNYHQYLEAENARPRRSLPQPIGLRTVLKNMNQLELAVVSYRTLISFRVAFEYELVRAISAKAGNNVVTNGKTLQKAFESFLYAYNKDTQENIITNTGLSKEHIKREADKCIDAVLAGNFVSQLTPEIAADAGNLYKFYEDMFVPEVLEANKP